MPSPDTRYRAQWEVEAEIRQMREAEDAPPKGEHLLTRRNRVRREAQERLDGRSTRYGR